MLRQISILIAFALCGPALKGDADASEFRRLHAAIRGDSAGAGTAAFRLEAREDRTCAVLHGTDLWEMGWAGLLILAKVLYAIFFWGLAIVLALGFLGWLR
jgi:hypothetical protein